MKTITLVFFTTLLTSMQVAAEIYKCTDAGGEVHYGDQPCKGESTIFIPAAAPKVDENATERRDKTGRLLRAYEGEHAEAQQKAADLQAEKEVRASNCTRSKNRLSRMLAAGRLYRVNKDGTTTDYTEEERAEAIENEKAAIEAWCDQ